MVVTSSPIVFTFHVTGEKAVVRRLDGLNRNAEDLSPALERIGNHFRAYVREVFRREGGGTESGTWAPLRDAYRLWKARFYPGMPRLQLEGDLRKSLTERGAKGNVHQVGRQQALFGSNLRVPGGVWFLATLHQTGYTVTLRDGSQLKIPARRIIDPPPAIVQRWTGMLMDHLWE